MADTIVFIPAWNEEEILPSVLDELAAGLPDTDVLVVDDGSTDRTAGVAVEHGARVLSFGENRGLRAGIAAGYGYAHEHGYAFAGRVDADGQHPVDELVRLLAIVRSGAADVAVGSRFVSGDGYEPYRYEPSPSRRFGTAVLRRGMKAALGRPFHDATSGMYAVNARALPILAEPYESGAPEVESLLRLQQGLLTVVEVPVDMRERASGESKLQGKRAIQLVLTVAGTLVLLTGWARGRGAASEAELMARSWTAPCRRVVVDSGARSTFANVAAAAAVAREVRAGQVVLVTSAWHAGRASALLRAALRGSGSTVELATTDDRASLRARLRELACWALVPFVAVAARVSF